MNQKPICILQETILYQPSKTLVHLPSAFLPCLALIIRKSMIYLVQGLIAWRLESVIQHLHLYQHSNPLRQEHSTTVTGGQLKSLMILKVIDKVLITHHYRLSRARKLQAAIRVRPLWVKGKVFNDETNIVLAIVAASWFKLGHFVNEECVPVIFIVILRTNGKFEYLFLLDHLLIKNMSSYKTINHKHFFSHPTFFIFIFSSFDDLK